MKGSVKVIVTKWGYKVIVEILFGMIDRFPSASIHVLSFSHLVCFRTCSLVRKWWLKISMFILQELKPLKFLQSYLVVTWCFQCGMRLSTSAWRIFMLSETCYGMIQFKTQKYFKTSFVWQLYLFEVQIRYFKYSKQIFNHYQYFVFLSTPWINFLYILFFSSHDNELRIEKGNFHHINHLRIGLENIRES